MKNSQIFHKGPAVPLDRDNIDTDQIIPARFLKAISRDGFGDNLFRDWRYRADGNLNNDFILNSNPKNSKILLAGRTLGVGQVESMLHGLYMTMDLGLL